MGANIDFCGYDQGDTTPPCNIPGPATGAELPNPANPQMVGIAPNGDIHLWSAYRIYRVRPPLPGVSSSDIPIASSDGSQLYVFDDQGRHLYTQDALTGRMLYQFAYNADHTLASITDADDLATTIDYSPTYRMVSPYGHITSLSKDASGYLDAVTPPSPILGSYGLAYNAVDKDSNPLPGLLTNFTPPEGSPHQKTYAYTDGSEAFISPGCSRRSPSLLPAACGNSSAPTGTATASRCS